MKAFFAKIKQTLQKVPKSAWIIGGVSTLVVVYSLVFFIPKSVAFSYAADTCVDQLTLFPGMQRASSDTFDLSYGNEHKIGNVVYASTEVCFAPKVSPEKGTAVVVNAPFGGFIGSKQYNLEVPSTPSIQSNVYKDSTLSTARPLVVPLSSTDRIHKYVVEVADKQAPCAYEADVLECDVPSLDLNQGAEYTVSLHRSFNGGDAQKLSEEKVTTLLPVKRIAASIENEKTVYDAPKEFSFTYDRPLESADISLVKLDGDAETDMQATVRLEDAMAIVSVPTDLARKAQFRVKIDQVISDDGRSLEGPEVINFATSGGPKVSNVSVGASMVAPGAAIVVTLDQPVADDTDLAKVARITGATGTVSKRTPTELLFTLSSGAECQAFSLVLDEGIKSGSNNEVSEPWKFDSRTICGTSSVIGYSVKGRPIVAYYFGSGATTVLVTAGIHGSEPSSTSTIQAWVQHLQANAYSLPADKRIVVVPNANPDGIAAGTRYNANNVNLGRNFPSPNWKADIETASGMLVNGGGSEPGSEPEAKALINLTRQLRPRMQISFHAQGSLVGANLVGDSVNLGNTYAKTVGYGVMFGNPEAYMGYPITGEFEDWMGEEMGIPAILIELPRTSGNYLSSQLSAINKVIAL